MDQEKTTAFVARLAARGETKKSLQEELGLTNETLLHCYQCATHLHEKHSFSEAVDVFSVLTLLQPLASSFWVGLGVCEEMRGEYHSSLLAYVMALDVNHEDRTPALLAAQILVRLGETNRAKDLLDQALSTAGKGKKYTEFRDKAVQICPSLRSTHHRTL